MENNLSEPFTVIMTDKEKCCDFHPVGALIRVQEDKQGIHWVCNTNFTSILSSLPHERFDDNGVEVKECSFCNNNFELHHIFDELSRCTRCSERDRIKS